MILKRLKENHSRGCISLTIYYTIILKFKKFTKNTKIRSSKKKSTNQADDIILDAGMKFKNFPITTVGEDAFYKKKLLYIIPLFQKFAK